MSDRSALEKPPRWWHLDRRSIHLRLALIRLCAQASPVLAASVAVLVVIESILAPLLMEAVAGAVAAVGPAVNAGAGSRSAHDLLGALIVAGALFALNHALSPFNFPLSDQLAMRARTRVFLRILDANLTPASIAHLEDPEMKDLVESSQDSGFISTRQAVCSLAARWGTRLGGVGPIALLCLFHWWAGLLMLVVAMYAVRRMRFAHVAISRNAYQQTKRFRRSDYLRELILAPGAEKEIRIFGLGDWLIDRLTGEWMAAMGPVWARRAHSARDMSFGRGPLLVVTAVVDGIALSQAFRREISLRELVIVLQATLGVLAAATVSNDDTEVELGIRTLEATEQLEIGISTHTPPMVGSLPADDHPIREIRFDDVRFGYPGSDHEVLRGIDLTIPVGRSLAIVGENGAGKTTLIKLLTRLYDPTSGQITADDIPLTEFDPTSWQQRCSAIFQDFIQYPWTFGENIALRQGADHDTLARAARSAGALDIVAALPNGWDTVLSRQFGGVEISTGQWQRIALARALYAAETRAGILVLDEPTAYLDARQEAAFYRHFLEVTSGRTTVLVSHRFSAIRQADHIVVIELGSIVESGTHDELVALDGSYAQMFSLQASRFSDEGHADA